MFNDDAFEDNVEGGEEVNPQRMTIQRSATTTTIDDR